jgi:hypothetical protein
MSRFRTEIIAHLNTVPVGCYQRFDGIRFEQAMKGDRWWFLRWRLDRLVAQGVLERMTAGGAPGYRIKPEEHLQQDEFTRRRAAA